MSPDDKNYASSLPWKSRLFTAGWRVEIPCSEALWLAVSSCWDRKHCFPFHHFHRAFCATQERLEFALYHVEEIDSVYEGREDRGTRPIRVGGQPERGHRLKLRAELAAFLHAVCAAFDLLAHVLVYLWDLKIAENEVDFRRVFDKFDGLDPDADLTARLRRLSNSGQFRHMQELRHVWTHRRVPELATVKRPQGTFYVIIERDAELGTPSWADTANLCTPADAPAMDVLSWCRSSLAFAVEQTGSIYEAAQRHMVDQADDLSVASGQYDAYYEIAPQSVAGRLLAFMRKWQSGQMTHICQHLSETLRAEAPDEQFMAFLRDNPIASFSLSQSFSNRAAGTEEHHFLVNAMADNGTKRQWWVTLVPKGETWRVARVDASPPAQLSCFMGDPPKPPKQD